MFFALKSLAKFQFLKVFVFTLKYFVGNEITTFLFVRRNLWLGIQSSPLSPPEHLQLEK